MNRKDRRTKAAESKKALKKAKHAGSEVEQKMALFGRMPDNCNVCQGPFDKKNKEMVMSWHVIVREKQEKVNLYCPTCWTKGVSFMKMMQGNLKKKDD